MRIQRVGNCGLQVSSIGLGTLTWGADTSVDQCNELMHTFVDAGGNLVDTASFYGQNNAEKILGAMLESKVISRSDLVLSSKSGASHTQSRNYIDISRRNLLNNIDHSLKTLGTDHLDIWFIAQPDFDIRFEELVSTLEYVLSTGRAQYVGLSNFPAWAVTQINAMLSSSSNYKIAAVQAEYSLAGRSIEQELVPACNYNDIGIFAWAPLARGVLTGKYIDEVPSDSRAASQHLYGYVQPYLDQRVAQIVQGLKVASENLNVSIPRLALSWVEQKPYICCALLGSRTPEQLSMVLSDVDYELPSTIEKAFDEISEH